MAKEWGWLKAHLVEISASAIAIGVIGFIVATLVFPFGKAMFADDDNYIIAIFTLVLGATSIIQGLYLARQDRRLRESIDDAKNANQNATDSIAEAREANRLAQLSADEAAKANEYGRGASERSLRAYLSIETQSHDGRTAGGITYSLIGSGRMSGNYNFFLMNRGKTPAYKVRYNVMFEMIDQNAPVKIEKIVNFPDSVMPLNPDQYHRISGVFSLDAGGDNRGTQKSFLVYGRVLYEDAFQQERWLTFAYVQRPDSPGGITHATLHSSGNDSN